MDQQPPMQYRRFGKSALHLSTVGFGTCQLRNVPEPQAIATLRRGFELGVNWVHTAPDYGGAEALIARAIAASGREDIIVLSNGYGEMTHFRWLFSETLRILAVERLPVWGISCIDDAERMGWDVWGEQGMVAYLCQLKREGRIDATFCTTHGPPDYVERLITGGKFDGIMLSYNPLGFHVLSYDAAAEGHAYEDLAANRQRIFPLAAQHQVSLLIMKPLAGGLLAQSKAFPPKANFAAAEERPPATAILRHILAEPGVTAVCPGTAAVAEAEENARAGWLSDPDSSTLSSGVPEKVAALGSSLCSRCGGCAASCSRNLHLSWLFRDGYIWNIHGDSFEANTHQHYFHLHPEAELGCVSCTTRTCSCPRGLDIPRELARVHKSMLARREEGWLPATPAEMAGPPLPGRHPARLVWSDIPSRAEAGRPLKFRFWVENAGPEWWLVDVPHHGEHRGEPLALAVYVSGRKVHEEPVRHEVEPSRRTHFAFDLPPTAPMCTGTITFALIPQGTRSLAKDATVLLRARLSPVGPLPPATAPFTARVRHLLRRWVRAASPPPTPPGATGEPRYGVTFLAHNIPAAAPAGSVLPTRLRLGNSGDFLWQPHPEDGRCVDLALFIDGVVTHTVKLPRNVAPGEEVTVHFSLTLPLAPGHHELLLHLVKQQVATFPDRGAPPLVLDIELTPPPAEDRQAELWSIYSTIDPWHYMPTYGVNRLGDGTTVPVFARSAKGCRIVDAAGREYLDYTMGWGTTLLGYAHPEVVAAVQTAAAGGMTLAWPTEIEMEVAAMVQEDIPCAEMVVFGKNGTDACTVAVRLSRLFTGRKKVLYCGYHGFGDWFAQLRGFDQSGVPSHPEQLVHFFRFLDLEDFQRKLAAHRDDLACVILEPSGPWGGNERGFEPDCTRDYLTAVATATRAAGAVLVFDEIITGYRYPGHSVQAAHGVIPDLACFGKALASGMPLSAVAGRRDIFAANLSRCHYGPTFKGETLSFAAAKATIQVCRREPVAEHCWHYGERLRAGIHEICTATGLEAQLTGPPFRMSLLFGTPEPTTRHLQRSLLHQELLRGGLSTYNGVMLPCYAHNEGTLTETLAIFGRAAEVVADATVKRQLAEVLELPLLIDL